MEKTVDILKRENGFKSKCNNDRLTFDQYVDIIFRASGVKLPNLVTVYRNKIWEFEMFFEEKGIYFFDENCYLRPIVLNFLNNLQSSCYNEIIAYSTVFIKVFRFRCFFKGFLNYLIDNINNKISLISDVSVDDLPDMLETSLDTRFMYTALLPDSCVTFTKECLRELSILGFDSEKDVNVEEILRECDELEQFSSKLIESDGLDSRIEAFNKFVSTADINITSDMILEKEDDKTNTI